MIPIDRAKMRIKIVFGDPSQSELLQDSLLEHGHKLGEDFILERQTERFLEMMIQPNLFREINDLVKKSKDTFHGVSIEIED